MKISKYRLFDDLIQTEDLTQDDAKQLNYTKQNLLPTSMLLIRTTPAKMKSYYSFKPSIWLNGVMPEAIFEKINDLSMFIKYYKVIKSFANKCGLFQNAAEIRTFPIMMPQNNTSYHWITSHQLWGKNGTSITGSDKNIMLMLN